MTVPSRTPRIVLLSPSAPVWDDDGGVAWCGTLAELEVRVRSQPWDAAIVHLASPGLDRAVLAALARWVPIVLVGDGAGPSWTRGIARIPALPARSGLLGDLLRRALDEVEPAPWPSKRSAPVLAVVEAPGGSGATTAAAIARSLPAAPGRRDRIVLADWTLDALHRPLHGLADDAPGLAELASSSRFGPPDAGAVASVLHPTAAGYRVLPGLRRHGDWVEIGEAAAEALLEAVCAEADAVVLPVERDVEGERDTGSFDVEDRNALARTAVRAADLVVVAAGLDRAASLGAAGVIAALSVIGVPHHRVAVVTSGRPRTAPPTAAAHGGPPHRLRLRPGASLDRQLGGAIRALLASVGQHPPVPEAEPRRIEPGSLGHWGQAVDGWITPRTPQQP